MQKKVDLLTGRTRISRYAAEKVVPIKRPDGDHHACFITPSMIANPRAIYFTTISSVLCTRQAT